MNVMQRILQAIQDGTTTPQGLAQAQAAPVDPTLHPATVNDGYAPAPAPTPAGPPAAPAERPHMGVLGAIGHVLAPEAGSFWQSALANGLPNARAGQVAYQAGLQKTADDHAKEQEATALAIANRKKAEAAVWKEGFVTTPTGSVLGPGPGGTPTPIYEPPIKPTETERLIEVWNKLPKGPYKDLVERAIKGAQYSPDYVERDTRRKIAVTKSRPVSGRARAIPKPPGGAVEF